MPQLGASDIEQLRAQFERQLDVGLHHGAQLAVYVDGDLVVDFAGGSTGPDGDGTTPETRHMLFSCTKPFAGVGLHQLVKQGKLDYDDRVVEHWPEFADDGTQKASITVRQVLSHTAGIPFGELIRRCSGQPVEDYVAENVFEPLGMDDTGIGLRDDEPDDVATLTGHEAFDRCHDVDEGLEDPAAEYAAAFNQAAMRRAVIPAANGVGTARDMARFYACLANGGSLDGTELLTEATVDEATTTHAETESDGTLSRPARYGLGVWTGGLAADMFGAASKERMFGHAGLGSSFGWGDPELNVGFALVTNGIREESFEHAARVGQLSDAVRLLLQG
ncbi:serine hydrolase [Haloarcula sp. Atlit-7R]|uniref:serine hydrolase domain-containing protein n=1 Tax=Haloarcula sp. Atlit-7R TaxID=2282125 RepID=UPI000EF1458D|nr:serine hydrolase domain-containing protein [Haloarcula sp. Atlit-7R]RLM97595.1 class A beta-lactamase-related serine hydrolase [Haloarcula sp. Atlit-7R]